MTENRNSELYLNMDIKGRKWAIKKIDAMTAIFYAEKIMGKHSGYVYEDNKVIAKTPIEKSEFLQQCKDFLVNVYEVLPGGYAPVLRPDGSYGVAGVQNDGPLLQILLNNAITHSVKGFFPEEQLIAANAPMMDLLPQSIQQSINSSISLSEPNTGNSPNFGTLPTP